MELQQKMKPFGRNGYININIFFIYEKEKSRYIEENTRYAQNCFSSYSV